MTIPQEIEVPSQRTSPRVGLVRYLAGARPAVVITAALLYACLLPLVALDLCISVYQAVCFPIYKIPKVARGDFFIFDRGTLPYLNVLERLHCVYCSYANGLLCYVREIAGRTEQHWCPIKHGRDPEVIHSRYERFLPYADPSAFHRGSDETRQDFDDLRDK